MVIREDATILEHKGPDALDLLHRLTTRALLPLDVGQSRRTVLTSDRGRVIDVFLVAHHAQDQLLLISDSSDSEKLKSAIDYYTIIEDAKITDRTSSSSRISLVGPKARQIAQSVLGITVDPDTVVKNQIDDDQVFVVSDTSRGVEWIDVVCESDREARLTHQLAQAGAVLVDRPNFELFRIDNEIPGSGREYGEHANPIEAGLLHLIDWNKGCYVGQEVIARLDAYDKVQRNVRVLISDTPLTEGTKLASDAKPAGIVTSSSTLETEDGDYLNLALVRKAFLYSGAKLDSDGVAAVVR
jgi:folate-binding protein YgfZ